MTSLWGNICRLTLWASNSTLVQFLSESSSFQIIQQLGPETVNHFTFWITTIPPDLRSHERGGCFQPSSPSGCSKTSNAHSSCHLMKCLVTEQVEFQQGKPHQHNIFNTTTVIPVARRFMRSSAPSSRLQPGIYNQCQDTQPAQV